MPLLPNQATPNTPYCGKKVNFVDDQKQKLNNAFQARITANSSIELSYIIQPYSCFPHFSKLCSESIDLTGLNF